MRKWKVGDAVQFSTSTELEGVGKADKQQHGTILRMSPCRRHCAVRLDDETEVLIETRQLKKPLEVINHKGYKLWGLKGKE